ncbi:MAG: UDP-N-acetylmuramate dehydrogenase [Planctomycetes bacterium]|nr:UDP-N-acetylmuramate dehydrogenase [Planctomycetota bacterium]
MKTHWPNQTENKAASTAQSQSNENDRAPLGYAAVEDLSRHTSFGIGGPAEFFFTPAGRSQLIETARRCREAGLPTYALGKGTNLLVSDEGVKGAVISTAGLQNIEANDGTITADCGVGLPRLIALAEERGLSGLEPLAGIPGSLGGAIKMNAGTASRCIADVIKEITLLTPDGGVFCIGTAEADFGYRCSGLDGAIVLSATFRLLPSDRRRVAQSVRAHWQRKAEKHPTTQASAGCIFKNPPGNSAGRILDHLGLKGAVEGGARISEKHANFIINCGRAKAADVKALIRRAREAVLSVRGIILELEIEVW